MIRFNGWGRAAIGFAALVLVAAPALPQGRQSMAALARLEPGLWQLRDLDDSAARLPPICVADPAILMQIEHRNAPCSRLVISSDAEGATVHYTCPAGGFGRTSLRVETPRLAQIDTQGISGKIPFAHRIEARRTGSCNLGRARSGR